MEWNKTAIKTTAEAVEAVCGVLMESGITGMEIDDPVQKLKDLNDPNQTWDYIDDTLLEVKDPAVKVIFYVSANPYGNELLLNVREGINRLKASDCGLDLGSLEIETENNLNDEVWLNKWKEYYKPFTVGEKLYVKPVWEDAPTTDRIVLTINPGNAFGTGLHQTTRLCMEQLEKYVTNSSFVLDAGCGSGILSIVSLLLGAKSAFALDIDENVVKTAYENAALNNIDKTRYYVTSGNIIGDENLKAQIGENKYDIVVANIVADVIIAIIPSVKKQLKQTGVFITSGIIKERLEDVYAALEENNMKIISTSIKDEWCCITAVKGDENA